MSENNEVREIKAPKESKGVVRFKLLLGLLTAIAPIAVACIQLVNSPNKVPETILNQREQTRLLEKVRDLEDGIDDLENEFFRFVIKTDFLLGQLDDSLRKSLSEESALVDDSLAERNFAMEPSPVLEATPELSLAFASSSEDGYAEWDDYEEYAETLEGASGPDAHGISSYLTGWIYLGQWDDDARRWSDTTVFTDLQRTVKIGDVITLAGASYIRETKPATLFLMKGDPIGPEILFQGSEVEILAIESVGLIASYSWAKVHVIYESK